MQKNNQIGKLFAFVSIVLLAVIMCVFMGNTEEIETVSAQKLQFVLAIFCVVVCIKFFYEPLPPILIFGFTLSVLIFFSMFMYSQHWFSSAFLLSKAFLWLLVMAMGYVSTRYYNMDKLIPKIIFILAIFLSWFYITSLDEDFSIENKSYTMTSVYYILCCLPFFFHFKSRTFKIILIIIISGLVLVSFKRSAIVCFVAVLLILYFANAKKISTKGKIVSFFAFIAVAFLANYLYGYFFEGTSKLSDILNIWDNRISFDGGREDVWLDAWNLQLNSSFTEWFFGHGYNAVAIDNITNLSAHNDFLEILYNYGLISLIAFIAFIIKLFSICDESKTKKEGNYNGFLSAVWIFIVASLPSHMLTYSTYFLLLSFYFGYASGIVDRSQKI